MVFCGCLKKSFEPTEKMNNQDYYTVRLDLAIKPLSILFIPRMYAKFRSENIKNRKKLTKKRS